MYHWTTGFCPVSYQITIHTRVTYSTLLHMYVLEQLIYLIYLTYFFSLQKRCLSPLQDTDPSFFPQFSA